MKLKTLILPLLIIPFLCSCGGNGDVIGHEEDINRMTYQGVHQFNCQETDEYLAKNKASDYKIVIPNNPSTNILQAKDELKTLFEKATGVILDDVTEDAGGIVHSPEGKYISIGDTKMFLSSGLELNKNELGSQAVRIQTKDKTVYLNGGDDLGCVFAVYDFLEVLFDFDTFSYDCVHLNKLENVKFQTMDITDVPDIPNRSNAWASIKENPNNIAYRLRTPYDFSEYFLPVGDTSVPNVNRGVIHNSLLIIPKTSPLGIVYKDYWFANTGDQICYTAHGNEVAYQALIDQTCKIIEDSLVIYSPDKYPLRNYVSFTIMDNQAVCSCEACRHANETYGCDSGSVIVFCNKVMEQLKTWMNKGENAPYRRDDLKLVFFAYNSYINAPAHLDAATNKFVVNHPDCQMRNDVGVYYAVSSGWNYQKNIYDEGCAVGVETYKKWCDICSNVLLWTYNANFGAYLSHVNSTNFYNTDAYQAFAAGNVKLLYNQGAWNSNNLTAYQMLAIYLDAKMSWNCHADINALIDRYFKYMYGSAEKEMKELFEIENMYAILMHEKTGALASTGIINKSVQTTDYYPFQMLKSWLSLIDKARSKIEAYKETDITTYNMIKEHIDLEWVSPAYYMIVLYGKDYLGVDEYNKMVDYFAENILPLKQFLISERSGSLSAYITSLLEGM